MRLSMLVRQNFGVWQLSKSTTVKTFTVAALALMLGGSTSIVPADAWHGKHHRSSNSVTKASHHEDAKHKMHVQHLSAIEGFLVLDEHGEVLQQNNANTLFNPASTLKLATSLMALRKYGTESFFQTDVYIDGDVDEKGQVLGNIYVTGADPLMNTTRAEQLAKDLNAQGIHSVSGNLYVTPEFRLNIAMGGVDAGKHLKGIWEGGRRNQIVRRHHHRYVIASGTSGARLHVQGRVEAAPLPAVTNRVASMQSPKLIDILKAMLCHSDNGMADQLGSMMGGPRAVSDFVVDELGLDRDEVKFSSSSGLGVNRISPNGMSKVLVALKDELGQHHLSLSDILPVAGVDQGTLERRFTQAGERGTVVAKTGTLTDTDRGVSALAGIMRTQTNGELLFVIFEQHGSVNKFRRRQEDLVAEVQRQYGGPAQFQYEQKQLVALH